MAAADAVGPGDYRDEVEIDLLGRRVRLLEISREVSETMPVYPGHVSVNFWDHLTHEQVKRQRLPEDSPFRGYAVRGCVGSEHVSVTSTRPDGSRSSGSMSSSETDDSRVSIPWTWEVKASASIVRRSVRARGQRRPPSRDSKKRVI